MSKDRIFSDETLMAFADGELEGAELMAVENAIDTDSSVADRVAMFMETRRVVAKAYSAVMHERPPERLVEAIMGATPVISRMTGRQDAAATALPFGKPANENRPPDQWRAMAWAASLAAVVAGLAGYLAGTARQDISQDVSNAHTAVASAQQMIGPWLSTAVEGATLSLPNQSASVAVAATYRLSDGRICRVIEARHIPSATGADAVVCREEAAWSLKIAMPRTVSDGKFRPAGAGAGLDVFLDATGAGQALPKADVEGLIRQGWH